MSCDRIRKKKTTNKTNEKLESILKLEEDAAMPTTYGQDPKEQAERELGLGPSQLIPKYFHLQRTNRSQSYNDGFGWVPKISFR